MNARKLKRSHDARSVHRTKFDPPWSRLRGCCSECHDGDGGCAFPHYGLAPHTHTAGPMIGSTLIKPRSEWPENFEPDPECDGLGTYTHCLACGAGSAPGGD